MKQIRGGVTAPKGFTASGIHVGIRKNREKKDLALVWSDKPCSAAAVYTKNNVIGQPLVVTKDHLSDGVAQAIIVNSGNANTCTGEQGVLAARRMAALVAEKLPVSARDVVVASTGALFADDMISPVAWLNRRVAEPHDLTAPPTARRRLWRHHPAHRSAAPGCCVRWHDAGRNVGR